MIGKIKKFLIRQVGEVRDEGWLALGRNLAALVLAGPGLLAALVVRLMRPVVTIRFGKLPSHRLGHFATSPEIYACRRDLGLLPGRTYDLFYFREPLANRQLARMWKRVLPIRWWVRPLDLVNQILPGARRHTLEMFLDDEAEGIFRRTPPHLTFNSQEEARGQAELKRFGLDEARPLVCLFSRDSAYLEATYPGRNWEYHDYRDSDVGNFRLAAEELAERGYLAFRMGALVRRRLDSKHPRVIDYANDGRTDFMDVYLASKCRFFISDAAGPSALAVVFRRPLLLVNYIPINDVPCWNERDTFIPKKLWSRESARWLTFRELIDTGAAGFLKTEDYHRLGLEAVENSPEEIRDAALEMHGRLEGTWRPEPEDEDLQREFWSLFDPSNKGTFKMRIGAEFLRQNRELLG